MIDPTQIVGIVLAGGRSSRFGSNKALHMHQGETFLSHAIAVLTPLCSQVYISGCYSEYQHLSIPCIPDVIDHIGPMGGIYSALQQIDSPYYLFLSCDMPYMTIPVVQRLITIQQSVQITSWIDSSGTAQLFPLLISRTMLPIITQKIESQTYHLRSLYQQSKCQSFTISPNENLCFTNINSPSDIVC